MASFTFDSYWDDKDRGNIIPATHTFRVMLINAAGVAAANRGTWTKRSDCVAYEITATNYTAGGKVCAVSVFKDVVAHRQTVIYQSVNWIDFVGSAAGAIIYRARGGAASADELVSLNDFGAVVTISSGPMVVADNNSTLQH